MNFWNNLNAVLQSLICVGIDYDVLLGSGIMACLGASIRKNAGIGAASAVAEDIRRRTGCRKPMSGCPRSAIYVDRTKAAVPFSKIILAKPDVVWSLL